MRIVLVNRWYPPYTGFGGVAAYDYYLAHALAKQGHLVTVVAARWSNDVPPFEEANGIRVHRILFRHHSWLHRLPGAKYFMRALLQVVYSLRVAWAIAAMQFRNEVDVVEFAEVGAEGYVYLHLPWRKPVIVRCHTPTSVLRQHYHKDEMPYSTSWTEHNEAYCIRKADVITTPSHNMARVISQKYGLPLDQLFPIPNPIEPNSYLFPAGQKNKSDLNSDVLVLHVGRMERVKGIDVLAHAIPSILSAVPNCRFVFIGDNLKRPDGISWKNWLQDYFTHQEIIDRVVFTGNVDQQTLVDWYTRSDIAVVPSLNYESFSYTCAQAMAASLPVVATRMGGIPETVEDGICGLLVDPGKPEELAQAIIQLASDSELRKRLGTAGRDRVERLFAAERVARQMVKVYECVNTE